jgi:D-alanyl-D-alanine carboxypeptidase
VILALALAASTVSAKVDAAVAQAKLAGVVLVAKGDKVLVEKGYGTVSPGGGAKHSAKARWRLASITKQVLATAIMRMVARGDLTLDAPFAPVATVPTLNGITARMLLTHHSGLANPDDTPHAASEFPSFYRAPRTDSNFCLSKPATPNAAFSYNNCDYLVLGNRLEAGEGKEGERDNTLWPGDFARRGDSGVAGYVGGKLEPSFNLATFGTAGGLIGTARDVLRFDRALMTGKLLPPEALAEMWKPEGSRSYQALGQWVFPGQLKGCTGPKRIVQRDGEIGGVQTRNYILPDDDLVVIVFTNRSSSDFDIGEIWQGKGFSYDLLSAAACT